MTKEEPARGRPRDPEVTGAILAATLRLLGEQGYAGMSVEQVAAEAGVGKTAIYRRYGGKAELAAAAMALLRQVDVQVDTGGVRGDLAEMVRRSVSAMVDGPGLSMTGTLLVERHRNPELLDVFRARIVFPLRDATLGALERGVARGEVRRDADLEGAVEALWGQILGHFIMDQRFTPDWPDRAVALVLGGIAADGG